jgi:hypothetical protein
VHVVGREAGADQVVAPCLQARVDVLDRPAEVCAHQLGGLAEAQRSRAGELVDATLVAGRVQERRGRDGRDVLRVDERGGPVRGRDDELPASRPGRKNPSTKFWMKVDGRTTVPASTPPRTAASACASALSGCSATPRAESRTREPTPAASAFATNARTSGAKSRRSAGGTM